MDTAALEKIAAESRAGIAAPGGAAGSPPPAMGAGGDPGAAPAFDAAAEAEGWAAVPRAFGQVLCMGLPELADAYSDEKCRAWGEAMAQLAKQYGWSAAILGPWLGLAFATVPMAIPTVMAVKARRAGNPPAAPGAAERPATARAVEGGPVKVAPIS